MRDAKDKQTGDLLKTAGANRQSAYAERQRKAGRKQVTLWLTAREADAVKAFLERIRGVDVDHVASWIEQVRADLAAQRQAASDDE